MTENIIFNHKKIESQHNKPFLDIFEHDLLLYDSPRAPSNRLTSFSFLTSSFRISLAFLLLFLSELCWTSLYYLSLLHKKKMMFITNKHTQEMVSEFK